jgi:MYXO-CTERM domain-containing protein
MEPYGVRIAYDEVPPSHLPYAMVMMGGTSAMLGLGGSVLGVSCSSDCGDRWWRDTTFAFTANSSSNNASLLGTTALHEAAHAFGLGHIGDSSRVMNPFVGSANVTWATACTPYDAATGGINCQPTHDEFCDGGAQNSHAELLAYFGENSPDVTPPEVTILSPEDGLELEVGGSVTIEADITDDHDGAGWRLVIPEADQEAVAFTFEKQWQLDNLPEGTYTLRVEAIDHERNEGSDEVTIYVGVEPGETTDTGESDSDSDSDSGTSGGSDSDGSDSDSDGSGSSDTDTVGETDPDKDGCGCRTTGDGPRAPWMLGLLALLGLRRRAGDVVS